MQCKNCKQFFTNESHNGTVEYVSIIMINRHINNDSRNNYEPYMWLSKRINENKPMYNKYNCPGGHIRRNETEQQALKREFHEETGLVLWNKPKLTKIGTVQIDKNEDRDFGRKIIHVYELIMNVDAIQRIPCNTEPQNLGPWKQFTFEQVLSLPVIDSIKFYMCKQINRLIDNKHFMIIEGTIGAGKSTIIKQFIQESIPFHVAKRSPLELPPIMEAIQTKVIHEVTLSEQLKNDLQKFYEKQITPVEFQQKIELAYYSELCKKVLFDGYTAKTIYIFDRSQISTYIFSKHSDIPNNEIKQIKQNREYFDEIVKKGILIYISSSRERVVKNQQKRKRVEEEAIDINYLVNLHDAYYYLMTKAYKPINGLTTYIIDNKDNLKDYQHKKYIRRRINNILTEFFNGF